MAVVLALAPITGHHGDGEHTCGSLISHTQASDATPATIAANGYPATPGISGTVRFDACPPEDYQGRLSTLRTATPTASLALSVLLFAIPRRRFARQR